MKSNSTPDQVDSGAFGAMRRLGLFLVVALVGVVLAHYTNAGSYMSVDAVTALAGRLGRQGPLLLLLAGLVTPMMFLPRWPIAFLAGLLYGVVWGTLLAVVASTLGAWVHFMLSRTLLAPMTARLRHRYGFDHLQVPKDKQFMVLFVLRAFPLSSFVVTNLIAGALKLSRSRYVLASFLGMIPSTVLYAAWGKLMKKPDPHFYAFALVALVAVVVGAIAAQRYVKPLLRRAPDEPQE